MEENTDMEQKEEIESTVTNVDERKEVLDETVVDNIEELSKIRYFISVYWGLPQLLTRNCNS